MKKTALFLFAFVLTLWSCRSVQPTESEKGKKPTVAVVRLLDELRNQPPIKLPNSVTIRLGIASSESYIGGGVLLYCLATGVEAPLNETKSRKRLGPITYEVTYPWETSPDRRFRPKYMAGGGGWKGKGEVLFCALLPTPGAGNYSIQFLTLEGKPLVFTTITAGKPDPHPWQPAGLRRENKQWTLFNHPQPGPALPKLLGLGGTSNADKLPRLPLGDDAVETGEFKITLEGTKLCLSFVRPVVYTPDFPLLCRWWVNDKPVIPPALTKYPGRSITGMVIESKKVVVKLQVGGEKLGAKPGDTIGLQLLYSAPGWGHAPPPGYPGHVLGHSGGMPEFWFPVSNRIDFKYKGK